MTDLKTANEQLAHALKALESPEHDTDVREAEACRNRLMELDERIGARIKAKLEAHRLIADAWGEQAMKFGVVNGAYQAQVGVSVEQALGRKAGVEAVTAENIETVWYREVDKAIVAEICAALDNADVTAGDHFTADAWTAHHEEHTGKYALSGEEIPDPVLVNGVAEMQQAVQTDEH